MQTKIKLDRDMASLVGALNVARAHFYQMRVGYAPYIDYEAEAMDKAIREYLLTFYEKYDDELLESIEKLAWEAVLHDGEGIF